MIVNDRSLETVFTQAGDDAVLARDRCGRAVMPGTVLQHADGRIAHVSRNIWEDAFGVVIVVVVWGELENRLGITPDDFRNASCPWKVIR